MYSNISKFEYLTLNFIIYKYLLQYDMIFILNCSDLVYIWLKLTLG